MRCFGAAAVQCGEITNLPDRISAPAWAAPARPRWWASSELAPLTSPAPGLQTSNRQKLLEASSSQNPTLTYVSLVGGGASLPLVCVFAPVQRWTGEGTQGGGLRLACVTHPPSSFTILESTQLPTENRSRHGNDVTDISRSQRLPQMGSRAGAPLPCGRVKCPQGGEEGPWMVRASRRGGWRRVRVQLAEPGRQGCLHPHHVVQGAKK